MRLEDRFIEFVKRKNLFTPSDVLLLAVSGGVDSVVLCELLHRTGFQFVIAHCNFRLRNEESERDSEFVRGLAKKYGVRFFVKEFDTNSYASENKLSIQEAARELRYEWFNKIIKTDISTAADRELPTANWILTAHHGDDNIETMLMNFFRGTGIQGLRGILPKQGKLVRPLLPFRKTELVEFARNAGMQWVEDSSNQTDKYSRNYFRKNIIPALMNIYPEVEQNLLNNLQRFQEIEVLYYQSIQSHLKKLLEFRGNEIHVPILKLKKSEPLFSIVHEIIKPYNFTTGQVQEVVKLIEKETGKYIQSSTHRVIKNRKWLIITPVITTQAENIIIDESDTSIHFQLGILHLQKHPNLTNNKPQTTNHTSQMANSKSQIPDNANLTALVNSQEITYPLLLRKWKAGDYFYPLGMGMKKKKLARFLIDQKLSKSAKENVWVIEMNKKIIWVVGMRIDERFKVTTEAKPVLSIALERKQI